MCIRDSAGIMSSSIPHNKIMSISTTHIKTKSSSMLKQSDFRRAHKTKSSINTPKKITLSLHTKTNSILIHEFIPNDYRPAHKKKIIFSPLHQTQVNFDIQTNPYLAAKISFSNSKLFTSQNGMQC